MMRTLDQIRREGVEALRDRLGRAGMIRFLQQFELGRGNYVSERKKWVNQTSLSSLKLAARKRRKVASPRGR